MSYDTVTVLNATENYLEFIENIEFNVHLQVVKMADFMLCLFYHN